MTVLSYGAWRTNAELIADVAKLGYLDGRVLDLTFGEGKFWTDHRPRDLETNDLDEAKADWSFDVTSTVPEHWVDAFDSVVFDPPYRMSGRRDGRTALVDTSFDERFGLAEYTSPNEVLALISSGIQFAAGCVKPGGSILVKCQDQVCSGRKVWQSVHVHEVATILGLRVADMFHLIQGNARPQPSGRRQVHARSNASQLLVLR